MDLLVTYQAVNGEPVMSLDGVIDLASLPTLHDHLARATRDHPGQQLVVDLDGVHAVDDAGLGLLLGAAGRCREAGGDLVVVASSERLRNRLTLTGFERAVEVRERLT